jgi:inner membrane protein
MGPCSAGQASGWTANLSQHFIATIPEFMMSQQFLTLIADYGPWLWILLALVLFGIEALAPGIYALWFAAAAMAVGLTTSVLGVSLSFGTQMLVFVSLAIAAVAMTRGLDRGARQAADGRHLNDRGQQLVGRTVIVDQAIAQGRGRIRVGDTTWQVTGPDCPSGSTVKITASDGLILRVQPI